MKKDLTYYLEDTSRLKEISQSELDSWIAEKPFHQPLQMLAGIKFEMEENQTDKNQKVYAAYFAEDYEILQNGRAKRNNQRNKNTKQLAKTIDINPKSDGNIKDIESLPEMTHSRADQTMDEMVSKEVEQEFDEVKVKKELSSDLANDLNEELILSEILEEDILEESILDANESPETILGSEITHETVARDDRNAEVLTESQKSDVEPLLTDPKEDDQPSKVDYSEYSLIHSKIEGQTTNPSLDEVQNATDDINTPEIKQNSPFDKIDEFSGESLTTRNTKKKKTRIKKKVKEKSLEKKKKSKKGKGSKPKEGKKIKKDKSKKKKKEQKKGKIKGLVGKAQKRKRDKKSKKAKSKKEDKKVEYVIVDSVKSTNFKLEDYKGVSNYTSWLLQQESINDVNSELSTITQAKKNKSKKKKSKKKKSKSIKAALDSIKKQDSIISEPLANILASQGHKKKARKMYTKLALVFPDKKAYFEDKIESLKD